jgi:two-component system response regulator HydG
MSQSQILIVHPESSAQSLLASVLQSLGHGIEEAANDRAALRRVERGNVGLVISAVDPADPEALELTSYLRRKHSRVPVLLLFANPACDRAREATRLGATVLRYPAPAMELRASVTQALQVWMDASPAAPAPAPQPVSPPPASEPRAESEARAHSHAANGHGHRNGNGASPGFVDGICPRPAPVARPVLPPIVGEAPGLKQAVATALTAAATRTPVVIVGEQGTGKSTVARAIHAASPRADRPFVEVVCSGLDEAQLERELFGQTFGRSGGVNGILDRPGKVARAHGGTLFLDEVSALTISLQRQLLRLLQDGEFEPIGSTEPERADVRIVLASTENLSTLVEQGRLRREVYDRVGVVCLRLPPLRDRGDDVEALAEHFRAQFAAEFAKPVSGFTPDALDLLCRHDWPGNVRELESVIQRGVALCQGGRVTSANLSLGFGPPRPSRPAGFSSRPHVGVGLRPLKEALESPRSRSSSRPSRP